jgi:hypothetical protein
MISEINRRTQAYDSQQKRPVVFFLRRYLMIPNSAFKNKKIFKNKQWNKVCILEFLSNMCHYNIRKEGVIAFKGNSS